MFDEPGVKKQPEKSKRGVFMANVLIVEDEKNMQDIIVEYMRRGGHTCFTADDGVDALMILKSNPMDLMILDVMMPHLDGFSVCKLAREMSNMPIIMLTAKGGEDDKLKGYEYGADDYMTKPFSPKVLLAKANALLRRSSPAPLDALNVGKIMVIPSSHKVFIDGQEITLTHKEYELLYFLMVNPGQIFARDQLLNRIWGYDFEGTTRTVDTHIKTLRQKLGDEGKHIVTLIRSGYKFEVAV
ncbi:response regulator receiver domain protein [[Clostridium] hylemonae DSM 15053]|uniref:Stage 0 sporulation protein A homolog n=2 Tax=[Clostridium] hylemonae TaxID=89153 RepID=C0C3P9_9FIRM|nr:response regulator receiver domain protein [[Clostridium] hylemonae DSM 15053]